VINGSKLEVEAAIVNEAKVYKSAFSPGITLYLKRQAYASESVKVAKVV